MRNTEKEKTIPENIKDLLIYDENTGDIFWRISRGSRKSGHIAGTQHPDGYKYIRVYGVNYSLHRLIWLYVYGEWPIHQIDHINGIRNDNRISNLRDVPQFINLQNKKKSNSNNKTGMLGVSFDKKTKKYIATIQVDGIKKILGFFNNPENAHDKYLSVKRVLHEGYVYE